jgi:CheY-like chemotaxis protein
LEFLINTDPDVPAVLVGDPVRLGQILTNLASNAIKFTDDGQVQIHIRRHSPSGGGLEISVSDTGIGMTAEQIENIFLSFTQADQSITRRYGGSGLGLAIVKRLVELMGGEVTVESRLGAGSEFRLFLPFGLSAEPPPAAAVALRLIGRRALVVDDHAGARGILAARLTEFGLRADAAGSAREAYTALLRASTDDPYAVVFIDYRMPGIDGVEAARVILSEFPESWRPRVVLVAAFGTDEANEADELAGVCGRLSKPVTASSLAGTLARVFGDGPAGEEGAREAEKPDLSGIRVLVAEDNPINQQIIAELLSSANAQVQIAGNGQEALAALARCRPAERFDVLLMDLQMPVMDGYAATRAIRADGRYAGLPIVALTAHAFADQRRQCFSEGMSEHLSKPVEPAVLYRTVLQFARRAEAEPGTLVEDDSESRADVLSLAGVIDEAEGLYHVGGNARLYRSLLLQFAEEHSLEIPAIRSALAEGDITTATRLVHTMFGVSKTLGAKSLSRAAERISVHIKSGQTGHLAEDLGALEAALQRVITAIRFKRS